MDTLTVSCNIFLLGVFPIFFFLRNPAPRCYLGFIIFAFHNCVRLALHQKKLPRKRLVFQDHQNRRGKKKSENIFFFKKK